MSRHAFRLSTLQRLALAASLGLSLLTGLAWWLLHRFGQIEGDFGLEPHPAQAWLLRLHGAGAFATLIVLGTLLPIHVKTAWRARKNRRTGAIVLSLVAMQVITGYALYYADNPLRGVASLVHLVLGLALPAVLVAHIVVGRRRARLRRLEPAPYFNSSGQLISARAPER